MEIYSPGELNERVTIEQITRTPDGQGGYTEAWSAVDTVWAMVRPKSGYERAQSGQVDAPVTYLVVIRYRSGMSETNRLLWRGKILNIRFIHDPGPRRQFLPIDCDTSLSNG